MLEAVKEKESVSVRWAICANSRINSSFVRLVIWTVSFLTCGDPFSSANFDLSNNFIKLFTTIFWVSYHLQVYTLHARMLSSCFFITDWVTPHTFQSVWRHLHFLPRTDGTHKDSYTGQGCCGQVENVPDNLNEHSFRLARATSFHILFYLKILRLGLKTIWGMVLV